MLKSVMKKPYHPKTKTLVMIIKVYGTGNDNKITDIT
jgi:hypothetical protein